MDDRKWRARTAAAAIAALAPLALAAAQLPAPQAQGAQQFAAIGDLPLANGQTIRDCRVGFRTWGRLDAARGNAILVPTWFGGRSAALAPDIGPGKLYDSSRYFVIAVDALGNGVSSSPSNSRLQPGRGFPRFTIPDMVESQLRLLRRAFGLTHVYAVSGISMGGMQTFAWMTLHPDFMRKAMPIVGTPRQTSYDLMLWTAELHAIEESAAYRAGSRRVPAAVLEISRLHLTTPQYFLAHDPPGRFASLLRRTDAQPTLATEDYVRQLEAMIGWNAAAHFAGSMAAAARAVRARVLIVVSAQDHMVNPAPALAFARRLHAPVLELTGDCGHLAPGCESAELVPALHRFLGE